MVVSDTHLGDADSLSDDFSSFLDFLKKLEADGQYSIKLSDNKTVTIKPPTDLILLGDIMELWTPRGGDYSSVKADADKVNIKLCNLNCNKIYVLGNHDEDFKKDMLDFLTDNVKSTELQAKTVQIKFKGKKLIGEYLLPNGSLIKITPDHYPESDTCIQVGNNRYFFLHGHQFDKLFEWAGPLKKIPSILSKMSATLGNGGWIFVALLFFFIIGPFIPSLAPVFAQLQLLYIYFTVAWAILSIPKLFTLLAGYVWDKIKSKSPKKPKYLDINNLIEQGYYKRKKDTIVANYVIFGHTHVPEVSSPDIYAKIGKNFINTGSWVNEENFPHDTIVYIDETQVLLLQWDASKHSLSVLGH
ncbi:MAG: metallophosphoesterase [Candidatus Odinarchaeia archaeon]